MSLCLEVECIYWNYQPILAMWIDIYDFVICLIHFQHVFLKHKIWSFLGQKLQVNFVLRHWSHGWIRAINWLKSISWDPSLETPSKVAWDSEIQVKHHGSRHNYNIYIDTSERLLTEGSLINISSRIDWVVKAEPTWLFSNCRLWWEYVAHGMDLQTNFDVSDSFHRYKQIYFGSGARGQRGYRFWPQRNGSRWFFGKENKFEVYFLGSVWTWKRFPDI